MLIDMHLHTSEYSACASSPVKDQIRTALQHGLNAVFITDHMKLFPEDRLVKLRKKFPEIKIFQGIEVTVQGRGWEDFVVLGIHDPYIDGDKWTYRDLYKYVRMNKGYLIHAHPYRFTDKICCNTVDYPPDAVEVMSSNLNRSDYSRRMDYAKRINALPVVNSDSHTIRNTGKYYTELNQWCETEEEILNALRDRQIRRQAIS